jgi:hypothetical protein
MAVLPNAKHERFCQARAKGETIDSAYVLAGYSENRGNAARLNANESVQARIAEIQSKAATRTELTIASLTERLVLLADAAKGFGDASGVQASRACVMDIAKLNGMVIDKSMTAQTSVEDLLDRLDGKA